MNEWKIQVERYSGECTLGDILCGILENKECNFENCPAKMVYFALKAMDLPLRTPVDLWIDDGSASGWRPEKGEN